MSVAAKTGVLLPIGAVLLALGILGLAGSGLIIWRSAREPSGPRGGTTAAAVAAAAEEPYPLHFTTRLDEPLSRGLWLVKWLLALPHWFVLAFLWVAYPERLSRAKALFKPWLLSLPHWLIVGFFLGWWSAPWANGQAGGPPGLLHVLAVIGGAVLLFRGRYPRDVFALVVGMARWVARVTVYAGLMRDEYPPFRLDR